MLFVILAVIIIVMIIIIFSLKSLSKNRKEEKEEKEEKIWSPKEKFYTKVLLNKEETIVFNALLKNIKDFNIFPQVSMGEIIGNKNWGDLIKINQKRADFCITDKNFNPIAVIEYHGSGHNKGNYKKRDADKKQATESAGIIYHAILVDDLNDIELYIKNNIIPLIIKQ